MSAFGQPPAEGAAPVQAPPTPDPAAAAAPAADPVLDRVGQIADGLGGLTERFDAFVQAQQPPPEVEAVPDWWAEAFGLEAAPGTPAAPEFAPVAPAPTVPNPEAFKTAVQREAERIYEERNAPMAAQLKQIQNDRAMASLHTMLPHIADKANATPEELQQIQAARVELAQAVQQRIAGWPQQAQEVAAADPNFIADTFRAAEAQKLIAGQRVAGGEVPTLEAANGAHPGGSSAQEQSIFEQAHAAQRKIPKGLL